ncbi:hypothetical protein D9M71_329240 [compost metagenome]
MRSRRRPPLKRSWKVCWRIWLSWWLNCHCTWSAIGLSTRKRLFRLMRSRSVLSVAFEVRIVPAALDSLSTLVSASSA